MLPEDYRHSCVGTGFIVLDIIRNSVGTSSVDRRFAGGSCGNVLAILAYFGWNANAVGRIGDDQVGRELVADLSKWRVNTKLLQVETGRGTPIIVQENYLDARGRPRHRFSRACPACGATLPAYRPLLAREAESIGSQLPTHSVFYFDRVAPGALELARKSRASGALVVFEPSGIRDHRLFAECLKAAHVVKYANDRIEGVHDLIAQEKVPVEIETLGSKGLQLRMHAQGRAGAWKHLPAFQAPELRDAAGAGDWTTAGFIDALMSDAASVDDALADADAVVLAAKHGQTLAALNCAFEGARGLMYVADQRRIRELSAAIFKGANEPRVAELIMQSRADDGCANDEGWQMCSGSRALHE